MGGVGSGGQVGCEQRIEAFVTFQKKKNWGGGGVGVGGAGVRVDVNAMLGVGVMWGMGDVNQE